MRKILGKAWKTTISTVISAILVYLLGEGYIGPNEANLLSVILVALGLSINITTRYGK